MTSYQNPLFGADTRRRRASAAGPPHVPIPMTAGTPPLAWITVSNSARPRACRKRTKAVRSGVGPWAAKPQNRQKLARSSSASASRTSDRSCQVANSKPQNSASGGQPGSPFAAAEMPARWRSFSLQTSKAASSDSDGAKRGAEHAMRPPAQSAAVPSPPPAKDSRGSEPVASPQAHRHAGLIGLLVGLAAPSPRSGERFAFSGSASAPPYSSANGRSPLATPYPDQATATRPRADRDRRS